MKICTYLGHHGVYDVGIEEKLCRELERWLAAGEDILFYFHEDDMLSRLCKHAVDSLRAAWPARQITTVNVVNPWMPAEAVGLTGFDMVQSLPTVAKRHFSVEKRRARRWVFSRAKLLFMYCYDPLAEWEREYFRQIHEPGIDIVDLTEAETAARLDALIQTLPERNRYVLEQVQQGRTLRAIGEDIGLSAARVHELRHRAQSMLRTMLSEAVLPDSPEA